MKTTKSWTTGRENVSLSTANILNQGQHLMSSDKCQVRYTIPRAASLQAYGPNKKHAATEW